VEDCVREMVRGAIETYPEIADQAFLSARQVNLETIHQHNVVAERFGTFGEIRRELESGVPAPVQTSRRQWLDAMP
jgi:GTP cyclohydrolase I/GTP cyclohydrolase-4